MKKLLLSILILTSTSLYAQCQGDMNGDGIKNVIDIVALVNQVLSGDTECEEQSVHGCLDSQACNYDSGALIDNNSCYYCYNNDCDTYPEDEFDCDGVCLNEYVELWGECYNIDETYSLNLYSNQLTGEIPPEIGDMINLIELILENNQLTGEIPSEIGNLTNLEYLYLNFNELTGEIPPEIGNLTNLTVLILDGNQLTGEIPPEICNINSVGVYNNQLCPPYPECISQGDINSQDTSNCP